MKIKALIVVPLCCEKGKNTVTGQRGGREFGRHSNVEDKGIVWEMNNQDRYSPGSMEITYCPHCATHLPNEIPDIEVS